MSDFIKPQSGCFTIQNNLQGKTLAEIERILGFNEGRLSKGAKFVVATELPAADEFDFAGYTQVAGHHTREQYGNINKIPTNKWEKSAFDIRKQNAMGQWSLTGINRLVKVIPGIGHYDNLDMDYQYPPGSGVQQWKITRPLSCRIISVVEDFPNGRFIPDQGYTPVKYK